LRPRSPLAAALAVSLLATACGPDDAAQPPGEAAPALGTETVEDLPPGRDLERSTSGDAGIRTVLRDVDGEEVGIVTFTETADGAFVEAAVRGLEPGFHGFHLHENPECDPDAPDGPFTTAGGHWAEEDGDHGEHTGDLPPLLVNDNGTAYLALQVAAFDLAMLVKGPDGDGVAVVVHADPDNLGHIPDRYTSDDATSPGPDQDTLETGDAGDRVACGVPGAAAEDADGAEGAEEDGDAADPGNGDEDATDATDDADATDADEDADEDGGDEGGGDEDGDGS
jgi:superoxide dismutase, Cu-Zn family